MAGSHDGSDAEAASSAGAGPPDLHAVLLVMAETQRELLALHRDRGGDSGPRRARLLLSQVKLPEFDGAVGTSTKKYREWRKAVEVIRSLNQLSDVELGLIIFSQVTGRAKELIEVLDSADLRREDARDHLRHLRRRLREDGPNASGKVSGNPPVQQEPTHVNLTDSPPALNELLKTC